MTKWRYIMIAFFAVSSKSFQMFPATRRVDCGAFHRIGILNEIKKDEVGRYCYRRKTHIFNNSKSARSNVSSSTRSSIEYDERNSLYETVLPHLFRQNKTWKRLSHLLDMATSCEDKAEGGNFSPYTKHKSVADIGTDHGMLAMGLALTGNFQKVVGVDASDQALTYGALVLLEKIRNQTEVLNDALFDDYPDFPIEFRVGNGLRALEFGEADTICIAGMGVNTMLQILEQGSSTKTDVKILDDIGCERLVLQATNSRPRNLVLLYDRLQKLGWKVRDERIEKISSRWYITTRFDAIDSDHNIETVDLDLPGMKLQSRHKSSRMRRIFDEYCLHHWQWIEQDARASKSENVDPRDLRWLEYFHQNV